jgi:hypothetical protein
LAPRRYLGLELSGAKNQKTALAAIEYYPRERKTFLLDVYDRISVPEAESSDEALLAVLRELGGAAHRGSGRTAPRGGSPEAALLGVNVPLTLPPCVECTRRICPLPGACTVASVKWMREITRKASRSRKPSREPASDSHGVPGATGSPKSDETDGSETPRIRDFTPYTQRPVELWVRYQVLPRLESHARFDIDEALGGAKAPLTLRMAFLKRHLRGMALLEAWPKLSVAILARKLGVPRRTLQAYRRLEEGALARQELLEALAEHDGIFIYDKDLRKLGQSLQAFDAFICAYTALLSDTGQCARRPAGFPDPAGWVHYPSLEFAVP